MFCWNERNGSLIFVLKEDICGSSASPVYLQRQYVVGSPVLDQVQYTLCAASAGRPLIPSPFSPPLGCRWCKWCCRSVWPAREISILASVQHCATAAAALKCQVAASSSVPCRGVEGVRSTGASQACSGVQCIGGGRGLCSPNKNLLFSNTKNS